MGILDNVVEWLATQVMNLLDIITGSVLGALGCDMSTFLRYFPAAETMYEVFVAISVGFILLNLVWQLFKNFGLGLGTQAEDPAKLVFRSVIFMFLAVFSDEIMALVLSIAGTPYTWIVDTALPGIVPHRNVRDNGAFLTRPMRNALIQYQRQHPMERFRECAICIVHQYDEALGVKRIHDYDNVETKRYLDVIESVFLTNDTGLLCTVLQATQIGDRDATFFYLMPPFRLKEWVENSGLWDTLKCAKFAKK